MKARGTSEQGFSSMFRFGPSASMSFGENLMLPRRVLGSSLLAAKQVEGEDDLPRFIVYDRPVGGTQTQQGRAGPYGEGQVTIGASGEEIRRGDDYATRLMKYVPMEALA